MTIGFVCGAFDLMHAGHVNIFKKAKLHCDKLVVGLHIDPSVERKNKNKPIESVLERQIKLKACKYVDAVIVYEKEEDIPIMLSYCNITVRFLGSDYINGTNKDITAEAAVKIIYLDSLPIHTTDIRKRI